jgi:hypothetical protein
VLREALGGTGDHDPALAARRLLLGRALHQRHRYAGGLTDLHEADRFLDLAVGNARNARDPVMETRALLEQGDVQRALAAGVPALFRLEIAADSYRRAAAAARRADTPGAAALADRAERLRAETLLALGHPLNRK